MSTHRIDVIRIKEIEKHPNADALGLVQIDGFTCAVRLGDFAAGDLVAYVEPDYVVPPAEPFLFLCREGKPARIKAKKLRGVWSQGLLVKAPEGAAEGDDVMERMGIVRYEPSISLGPEGDAETPCAALGSVPKYDVENWRRLRSMFVDGEEVVVTEKLHGENSRFAFREGRMWLGSRTQWKRQDASHSWSLALKANPWIEAWCREYPSWVLYGEAYGRVPDMRYSVPAGQVAFRAFDIATDNGRTWMDAAAFVEALTDEQRVPLLYRGPYSQELMEQLAVGDSRLAKHLAEGIVIKPAKERSDPHSGRVSLKLVSNRYLEKA